MKSCPRYEESLSAYADGRCPEAERAELAAHLKSCEGCGAALRWIQAMKEGLAGAAAVSPPPLPAGFKEGLLKAARGAEARKKARAREGLWTRLREALSPRPLAGLGLAAGFAAAALMFVARPKEAPESVSLDDLLAEHGAYAATLPLAGDADAAALADALEESK